MRKAIPCQLGIHRWVQSRPLVIGDIWPSIGDPWIRPTRLCLRCGKRQAWLPGYGGSEPGCWLTTGEIPLEAALKEDSDATP